MLLSAAFNSQRTMIGFGSLYSNYFLQSVSTKIEWFAAALRQVLLTQF